MKLKLTKLGDFAYQYGVMTDAKFWKDTIKEISKHMDENTDWELMIEERIAGLKSLKDGEIYKIIAEMDGAK